MTLMASLLAGICAYLAVGYITGSAPDLRLRREQPKPGISDRALWLVQAGARLTPAQFFGWSAALGAVAFVVGMAVTGVPWVSLPPVIAVAMIPRWYFGRSRIRRLSEVHEAWPDGLRHVVASLRAGLSLSVSLEELARSGPEPLRMAFARYPTLSRTLGADAALEIIREELGDPATDRVVEVLLVAYERGGSIVPEVLTDLAGATTRDLRTVQEIRTNALEQRINGRIVFVIPWLVLLMLTSNPGPFRDFYASGAGLTVVVVGASMSVFGSWLVARLSRDDVEPRVFGSSATSWEAPRHE